MKVRHKVKAESLRSRRGDKSPDNINIRHCHGIAEYEACIRVERAVWKSSDIDVVPTPLFVVASHAGGQVLGAFEGKHLVGFTLAIAGWRAGKPFLHSHMTAVLDEYRDRGLGRRLKLFQREDALNRGIALIEWTFDPLVTKNAYFNFMRLGAIARRYLPNAYGLTTSPLHGSLPTDRLVAEWHLKSPKVTRILDGIRTSMPTTKKIKRIFVPPNVDDLKSADPAQAAAIQAQIRSEFVKLFGKEYAATAIEPAKGGMNYILEHWSAK